MSERASIQAEPRPAPNGYRTWNQYWTKEYNQSWRTEPEIDAERQQFLNARRSNQPDIEKSIYPFRDENGSVRLERADVEWLLATHESGGATGPVFWEDEVHTTEHSRRVGLDLRGGDLSRVNLIGLPLARALGGLPLWEWSEATPAQQDQAAAHFEHTLFCDAHLEGAMLRGAHLEDAALGTLYIDIETPSLLRGPAYMESADLGEAHLEGAQLVELSLEKVVLYRAHLQNANIMYAHLEGANLREAHLGRANLREALMDRTTQLNGAKLGDDVHGYASVADVYWGDANLAVMQWSRTKRKFRVRQLEAIPLGDEQAAWKAARTKREKQDKEARRIDFEVAVRANRQLATALRRQGMSADADRFVYKAQVLERQVLRREGRWLSVIGSRILDLISGYGYKPMRSLIAYIFLIGLFAGAYLFNAQFAAPHLTWDEALILSISAFHGRGFFTSGISLGDTLARLAAGEAIIGLLIEITFIATFTQRFFAR